MDSYVLRIELWMRVTYIKVVSTEYLNNISKTEVDFFFNWAVSTFLNYL